MYCRWLIVGLCFCAFSGCVSCQSNYDYCGPMPDEGGDFMYRKNSVLGGDPSMPLAGATDNDETGLDEETEGGPEPTPAPPPDEMPDSGMGIEGDDVPDTLPLDGEADEEDADGEEDEEALNNVGFTDEKFTDTSDTDTVNGFVSKKPVSTLQWHAPSSKPTTSPIKQVRFR